MPNAAKVVTLVVVVLLGALLGPTAVDAQAVPTSEAQAFIGKWVLPLQTDQPMTLDLDIHDHGGHLGAAVGVDGDNTMVTNITRSGDRLVLRYNVEFGGESMVVSITLTPVDENLSASLDVNNGAFTTSGTARRQPS